MADKQLLLKQNAEDGFFADDDPLAELARIASFDSQADSRPRPVNLRREPEFNLEDELLKEFEQYEEPATSVPAVQAPAEEMREAVQPQAAEPVFAEPEVAPEIVSVESELAAVEPEPEFVEPEPVVEPAREVVELRAVPEPEFEAPVEQSRPASHPVFDLEDEILREFAAFDAKRAGQPVVPVSQPAQVAASEPAAIQPVPAVEPDVLPDFMAVRPEPPRDVAASRVEPAFADSYESDAGESHDIRRGYGDDDLASETEFTQQDLSGHEDAALDAMEAEVDPAQWQAANEPIVTAEHAANVDVVTDVVEEPIDFTVDARHDERWDDEVSVETPAPVEQVQTAAPVEAVAVVAEEKIAPLPVAQAVDVAPEPPVEVIAAKPAIANVPEVAPAAAQRSDDFGLDALLADVERYPVNKDHWPEPVAVPKAAPVVEATARKPAERVIAPLSVTAAAVAPVAAVVAAAAKPEVVEAKAVPAAKVATPVVEPVAKAADQPPAQEAFDDGAFELDLTEIELDMLEMEVESAVGPAIDEERIEASDASMANVAKAVVEEKPAEMSRVAAVATSPAEDYSSLPFDPSQVSSEEDPLEALADMDVPEVPVVDHEIVAPTQPDYDIDIDAEMAHIFSRPAPTAPNTPQAKAGPQAPTTSVTSADLDEFERALEEDFRRSLSENRATSTPDRVALTPSAFQDNRRQSSTGRRLTILAASVAGLVLIGGAAVYAYWGSPGKILSTSSEPKIILADKDPIKVQPENRGGQQVPNQDKAVYDRVSGDEKDVAKQERLVTSNEEPVDVVQKTLMPENLPMEDEDQASTTDATDTSDPRLLPEGQDKNITTTEKVVSGVSPRKVRTMVVRSDGTLVPREEMPEDTAKAVTPTEEAQQRPLEVTPAATEEVPDRLTANDAIAKEIEQASADTKAFVPGTEKPADATPAQADDTQADAQPVTEDQPAAKTEEQAAVADDATKPADTTPIKTEEIAPATQDDTAADTAVPADQDAVKDAADAEVDAPVRPVKTTKITANTPIPENRPVDQPVDIVGRVTDRGNIRKDQEVATADPAQQPVDNTRTVEPVATPTGAYVIQIASLPSEEEAQSSYNKLSAKFSSVIGGRGVDIRKAAIKNKGTYYRVRIPVGSRQEATDLCSRYKAAGGSCLVSK